ncbi:MAG: DNA polymerase III subunit gamma/tau [Candidatus Pacebacteria bacterium]|nr:DNA polymerase III subunit gamma/tau [Candidatus Paceibacterota bacterium]
MSDTALYRKYRPHSFSEVVGQEHIVKVLEASASSGKIAHAYLFSGSRGTGKTSLARIFAETLGTSANDLNEIDAASNNGVDEVRALNEAVSVLPFESKYKVYIFDEVHMFSKSAWNALLKTLEEPPKHVIFILATTEIDKVPETIISRCQTFTFRKPSQEILATVVKNVAKKEGYTLEPASADLIGILADGSFRDALGIVQKILGISKDKKISVEEVEMVTGAPRSELVNAFIEALSEKNSEKGIGAIQKALKQNVDMKVYAKLILMKLRFVLLLKFAPALAQEFSSHISKEDFEYLKTLSQKKESHISSATLLEILSAYDMIGRSYIPELPLEIALVKLSGTSQQ